jgi:glycine/D-amino acid oxidase-like deaminating enzyme/nitrite reductase/ring-hydroxylating ferredoxin subunit
LLWRAHMHQKSTSLWDATSSAPRFDPLRGEVRADVAVIGAGITGITAAMLLRDRGKSVVVLEKESVGAGETGNTTAHITAAVDARYHWIRRKYGKDEARIVADASRAAMQQIERFIARFNIECHYDKVPGYLYTEKRKYVSELKNEAGAAREAGLDVEWTENVPLPFATRGGVLFRDQAQFHPGEYLNALATAAAGAGVHIYERTLVTDVKNGAPCTVETEHGRVTADAVIMATNVPVAGFTHVHVKAAAYRTYAMAFEVSGEHPEGLFWDTADPYHYTRWQRTSEGTFLIVGGEDHRTGGEEDTESCFARVEAYAREYFGSHPLRYRWSGQVIEPHGGLPLIGGAENVYISTGYSGQGMTFGTAGAMLVADLITGTDNVWAALFDYNRVRVDLTAPEIVTENVEFPKRLVLDRLTRHDVEGHATSELASGQAKILSIDGKKVAAYRDESGALHCVSPVCTHMKCDVAWNDAERTWDCPCHGSRFTPDGEVLNGPAREPLRGIEN